MASMSSTRNEMWRMPGVLAGGLVIVLVGRRVVLHDLKLSAAVRRLHHRHLRLDAFEAVDAVHPGAFDRHLAPSLQAELDEELGRGREVVDHDADVFHSFESHALDGRISVTIASTVAIGRLPLTVTD